MKTTKLDDRTYREGFLAGLAWASKHVYWMASVPGHGPLASASEALKEERKEIMKRYRGAPVKDLKTRHFRECPLRAKYPDAPVHNRCTGHLVHDEFAICPVHDK